MKRLIYAIVLCAMLSLLIPGPAYADSSGIYVVRPGDTMLRVAAGHGLSATQLAAANGLRWNDWLYVGQRLRIPGEASAPAPSTAMTYVVRPGDTLISIAARHRVTLAQLARANGLYTNAWVYVGQQLKIPGASGTPSAPAPSTGGTYVVRPGDTLTGIALRHGVGISGLAAANGLRANSWVYVGQRLRIPGSGSSPPAPVPRSGSDRWIDVNLSTQTLTAYEDQHAVYTARVSTGRQQTPTVVGTYHIYVKYVSTRMRGPGYDLPDVPYTMYFYQGYGLHGTYWHSNFGTPMSHGCVNLSVADARWLYNWAPVGTKVVTHY